MKRMFAVLFVVIMLLSCTAIFACAENAVGDVDGDGYVNLSDIAAVMKYCAGWDVAEKYPDFSVTAADVNADGAVNLSDVARLMKYVAKWDVPPPYIPGT
ncbi:MAG: dockerin type I repeat-containing protein [Clostridia bacterium]|nr:dockerin type I repeat-containing protein [Clostridia bacterium]